MLIKSLFSLARERIDLDLREKQQIAKQNNGAKNAATTVSDKHSTKNTVTTSTKKTKQVNDKEATGKISKQNSKLSGKNKHGSHLEMLNQSESNIISGKTKSGVCSQMEASKELLLDLIDDYDRIENGEAGKRESLEGREISCKTFENSETRIEKNSDKRCTKISSVGNTKNATEKLSNAKKVFARRLSLVCCGKDHGASADNNVDFSLERKQMINKQNEAFIEKVNGGKTREDFITEMMPIPAGPIPDFHRNQPCSKAYPAQKPKTARANDTRKTAKTTNSKKKCPPLQKNLMSKEIKRNSTAPKSGRCKTKGEMARNRMPSPRKTHLSQLPGFKNCSSNDEFMDMVLGKSIDKPTKCAALDEIQGGKLTESGDDSERQNEISEIGTENCPSGDKSSDDQENLHEKHDSAKYPQRHSFDEKYGSILQFYTTSPDNQEIESTDFKGHGSKSTDVTGQSAASPDVGVQSLNLSLGSFGEEARKYIFESHLEMSDKDVECPSSSNEESDEEHLSKRGSLLRQKGFDNSHKEHLSKRGSLLRQRSFDNSHLDDGQQISYQETEKPRFLIEETKQMEDNIGEGSSGDNFFKNMARIAFAPGLISFNSEASNRGTGGRRSEELSAQDISIFNQRARVNSINRSSISTQTSCDDSECGDDDLHDWVKGNILGRGSHGKVCLGMTSRGRLVAVKQVELSLSHAKEAEKVNCILRCCTVI